MFADTFFIVPTPPNFALLFQSTHLVIVAELLSRRFLRASFNESHQNQNK
jgi:hypothetical protein